MNTPPSLSPHPLARSASEALARIRHDDADLQAWVFVDGEAGGIVPAPGPLDGMPFGVKDVIDVAGLPTHFGLHRGKESADVDAWCVAALRAAGGVPIGKTHTTALAFKDPAPTRNPHDQARTPGGSSAGSAAAVAAGHVPLALGTQTIGSILRPASFCGIVGYKPTYGMVPMQGVSPLAPSVDHAGVLAADVEVAVRFAQVFSPGLVAAPMMPKIGFAAAQFAQRFDPEVLMMLERSVAVLRALGARVEQIALPACVDESVEALQTLLAFEAHAVLAPLALRGRLPEGIGKALDDGAAIARSEYDAAQAFRVRSRAEISRAIAPYDIVITGAANPAPGRESTGDAAPLGPWTFWGMPSLALPVTRAGNGMPIGMQVVAAAGADETLLGAARWIATALADARL